MEIEMFLKDDLKISLEAQNQLIPLRRAFSMATFPQVVKECLKIGNIDVGDARSPVSALASDERKKLVEIVRAVLTID